METEWVGGVDPSVAAQRLRVWMAGVPERAREGGVEMAEDMAAFAQDNRPWTDRTGAARANLNGRSTLEPGGPGQGVVTVAVAHGVEYGPSLEARGYGILLATLMTFCDKGGQYLGGDA